jgi:acetyl esterase/lipase
MFAVSLRVRRFRRAALFPVLIACTLLPVVAAERPPYVYPSAPVDPGPVLVDRAILRLYPGVPPNSPADFDEKTSRDVPALIVLLPPPEKRTGAAALMCPGGSYHHITVPKALTSAQALAEEGLTVFFLVYRYGQRFPYPIPLEDGERAMRLVRANAQAWGLDPKRIGVIGMSAGGHMASWLATSPPSPASGPAAGGVDPVSRASIRPDFQCLISPVISMREDWSGTRSNFLPPGSDKALFETLSGDLRVTRTAPPAFLWHALDDRAVAATANSDRYAERLRASAVPVEYVRVPTGGHVGGYKADWGDPLKEWLRKAGCLAPAAPTVSAVSAVPAPTAPWPAR